MLLAQAQTRAERPNVPVTDVTNRTSIATSGMDITKAEAGVAAAERNYAAAMARVREAEANNAKAQADVERYRPLAAKDEVPQQQFDQVVANAKALAATVAASLESAQAALKVADQSRAELAQAQQRAKQITENAPSELAIRRANVSARVAAAQAAQAQLAQALLNLSYSKIQSPVNGIVAKRIAEVGQHVAPGQQVFLVTQTDDLWVTANYRETQLLRMHPGQGVRIHVDALASDFEGYLESMPGASGSVTSLLPPENATGNFVKVVQRLPVRIRFKKDQTGIGSFASGHVRRTTGASALASQLMPDQQSDGWHPGHNPWAIALTVTIATFMEVMDTAIANVSLPHIAGGLSAGMDESTWVLTSYLVSNAVVLPISGWLSDRFGRKRFYMTCVAIFTVSSFLCGIAPSLGLLVFFRIVQGAGGGGLAPSEQAILADTFPPAKRGMAFAVYGMAVVLAPAIGPTLGGWITDNYSWRWIFYINVPFGILSLFLTSFMVEDPPHMVQAKEQATRTPIDFIGLVLVALGLGALQIVLDKGQRDDWFSSSFITTFSILAVGALVAFVFWEWRNAHPVVQLRLLRNSSFAVSCVLMLTLGAVLYGTTVLIPQFMQTEMGYTAQSAGEVLSAGGVTVLLLMPVVGFLVSRMDVRYLIGFGLLITGLALFQLTNINLAIDFRTAMLWRAYQSLGLAFLFVPINTISYTDMPPEASNQVSGLVNLMRNMGGSIGISAVETYIAQRQQVHQTYLARNTFQYNPRLQELLSQMTARAGSRTGAAQALQQSYGRVYGIVGRQATVLAYVDTFWIMGVVCLVAISLLFLAKKAKPGQTAVAH